MKITPYFKKSCEVKRNPTLTNVLLNLIFGLRKQGFCLSEFLRF